MNLEQTRTTPEASWEDHADDIKTTIKNAFSGSGEVEFDFFIFVDNMEYEDLLKAQEDIPELINDWKSDEMSDSIWKAGQEHAARINQIINLYK